MPENFESLVELARLRARRDGDREAFRFLRDETTETLTCDGIDRAARSIAVTLRDLLGGTAAGERVLLLYPPGLGFIPALFGCFYAGAVAVPAPVPDANRIQGLRLAHILADAAASVVLTDSAGLPLIEESLRAAGVTGVTCVATDGELPGDAATWTEPVLRRQDLAVLQYTSGSTSDPKGVMVSHGNLLANCALIQRSLGSGRQTRFCGWLPFYHDMGLVGAVLHTFFCGGWAVFLSPVTFLKRPLRWLRAIDEYRADLSVAPNFAYEMCVRKVTDEQVASLDLDSWTAAMNGSEPISAETLAAFADRFAPAGFAAEAVYPCYGMAETTLFVTGDRRDRRHVVRRVDADALERGELADGHSRTLVSSGIVTGIEVVVTDPKTAEVLPDGRIGELWIRGDSVALGYWGRPEESERRFRATTADGDRGYLRSGDLGTIVDGELYVTGRIKEMLIVHGRNVYPYDIERAVRAAHPALGGGVGAAFALGDDVVIAHEVRGVTAEADLRALAGALRQLTARDFGVRVAAVALVRPGQIPRTTSGKVQRLLAAEKFRAGAFETVHEDLDAAVRRAFRPDTVPAA
ncbi:fatty acyl-AMP ligase [Amycolatopsis sp. NPDC021455]|uniref:fatty acyl-AMP ligase n=1 Tax=Amycolatopsis sp. NPDC021455 TaxID=3154901 RepID=UPI0033EE1A32